MALPIAGAVSHVAAAPDDVYATDFDGQQVIRYSFDGKPTTVASGDGQLAGIAFDGKGNAFYAAIIESKIIKLTARGQKSTFASGFRPFALAFDRSGNLYAGDFDAHVIYRFTPAGKRTTVVTGVDPGSIVFGKDGALYIGARLPGC